VRRNSLHIVIHGDRIYAHIDTISPLVFEPDGSARFSIVKAVRYSLRYSITHNLSSLVETAERALSGSWNEHRCDLVCELVELDDDQLDTYLEPSARETADAHEAGRLAEEEPRRTPFNVVDELVDLVDRDATPWSVQLEVRVDGRFDEARQRSALHEALRRHPRGRARKAAVPRTRRWEEWEIAPDTDVDPLDVVDCPDDGSLRAARGELQSTRAALATAPPLRVRLARHPGGDLLMLNLNHAAADGFGGLRLLRSVARAYRGAPDPLPPHEPEADRLLPLRLAEAELPARLRRSLALAERLRDLPGPPARLAAAPAVADGPAQPGYGFHHARLGRQQTGHLAAGDQAGSVNDVLVAALHLAVPRWNAQHGAPCRRVTVLVPSNLRPPRWRQEAVGNFSLPARITTGPAQRSSPAALAAVIAQTGRKKQTGLGTALLQLLEVSHRLPLSVKRATVGSSGPLASRFVDTAILSNLGHVEDPPSFGEEAGDTTELWFSAPGRMPLGLSVGALTVAGRLHLVFRYDTRLLDAAAVEAFADIYLEQLRRVRLVRAMSSPPAANSATRAA
jgi:NRPS condensation-like uncharacterized protein